MYLISCTDPTLILKENCEHFCIYPISCTCPILILKENCENMLYVLLSSFLLVWKTHLLVLTVDVGQVHKYIVPYKVEFCLGVDFFICLYIRTLILDLSTPLYTNRLSVSLILFQRSKCKWIWKKFLTIWKINLFHICDVVSCFSPLVCVPTGSWYWSCMIVWLVPS